MDSLNPQNSHAHEPTAKCHSTPRLDALVSMARPSHVLADIGCDHAYLSILVIRSGAANRVIASDISDGPLAKAKHNVDRFGLGNQIELRKGDGLAALRPAEADCVVVAGMGGNVITGILKAGESVARTADKLLVQPMSSSETLRRFLYENGYAIVREIIVREDRRFYPVLEVRNQDTKHYRDFDCFFSPALFLSQQKEGLLTQYLLKRRRELTAVIAGMEQSQDTSCELSCLREILAELDRHIQQAGLNR